MLGPRQAVPPVPEHDSAQTTHAAPGPQSGRQSASFAHGKQSPLAAQKPPLPVVVLQAPGSPPVVVQSTSTPPHPSGRSPPWQPPLSWATQVRVSDSPCFDGAPSQMPEQQRLSRPKQRFPMSTQPNALSSGR